MRKRDYLSNWIVTVCYRSLGMGIFLALFTNPCFAARSLDIERLQRELQVRYYFFQGTYLPWPDCPCGGVAPPYPKADFYGDLSENPELARKLVADLADKFFNYLPYYQFVRTNGVDGLEHNDMIYTYSQSDLEYVDPSSVTKENYAVAFGKLYRNLHQLNYIACYAQQAHLRYRVADLTDRGSDLDVLREQTENTYDATTWYPPQGYIEGSDINQLAYTRKGGIYFADDECILFAQKGVILSELGNQAQYLYPDTGTHVLLDNGTFKRPIDLSKYIHQAAIYLWVYPLADGSGTGQPVLADSRYHLIDLSLGSGQYVSGTYGESDPIFQGDVPTLPDHTVTTGWMIGGAVALVRVLFLPPVDPVECAGCTGQGGQCSIGTPQNNLSSLHLEINLGRSPDGHSAGFFYLNAATPSEELYSPSRLACFCKSEVSVYPPAGTISQVLTAEGLFDLTDVTANGYSLNLYSPDPSYLPGYNTPVSTLLRTVRIIKNGSTNNFRLQDINYVGSTSTQTVDYVYSPSENSWERIAGSGNHLKKDKLTVTSSPTERLETRITRNSSNEIVAQQTTRFVAYDWGFEKVEEISGQGEATLTNKWDYYSQISDGDNYGHLKSFTDQNNHWERYQYDAHGRVVSTVSQFLNHDLSTADNLNRQTLITYTSDNSKTTLIEKLKGNEIARKYILVNGDQVKEVVCNQATASETDALNEISITDRYPDSDANAGKTRKITQPDGTITTYAYHLTSTPKTTVLCSGSANGDTVFNGTQTTTTLNSQGQTYTVVTKQILNGVVQSPVLSHETFAYDVLGHATNITYLDGRSVTRHYGCCTLEYEIDRDGTRTDFVYDEHQRLLNTSRNGLQTINTYDAAGNLLSVSRQGTNGASIVQRTCGYDLSGRLIRETNALGIVTAYANNWVNGFLVKLTTNAFGLTNSTYRQEKYYQDGSLESVSGSAVHTINYAYDVESLGTYPNGQPMIQYYTQEIRPHGGSNNEWTKTYLDMAGRSYRTVYAKAQAPYPTQQSFYNHKDQLVKDLDPDGHIMLYAYNEKGERARTIVDLGANGANGNGSEDPNGPDRITTTANDIVAAHGTMVRKTTTSANRVDGSPTSTVIYTTETALDGNRSWQTAYHNGSAALVTLTEITYNNGCKYVTTTAPDNSQTINVYSNGLLLSVTRTNFTPAMSLSRTTYEYDHHGRLWKSVDARNGATVYAYDNADRMISITTPVPGNGQSAQTTTTCFDEYGRVWKLIYPDGATVQNEYYPTGELKLTYGSRTYPVGYAYDDQGRMTRMTNWTTFGTAGERVTVWNYNPYRGWLDSKQYPGTNGPAYTYTDGGRLSTRQWLRLAPNSGNRLTTSYTYNGAGELYQTTYNDNNATPAITHDYDRLGRLYTVKYNGTLVATLTYNDLNQPLAEQYSSGVLSGLTVNRGYDTLYRRNQLSVQGTTLSQSFGYDNASRLASATQGTASAAYTYLANSPLVDYVTYTQNSTTMTTRKRYDNLNRLKSISSTVTGSTLLPPSFVYEYNDANQRTRVTLADGSFWVYDYDQLGQVISGKKYFADNTPVPGQQFEYGFDEIGNRTATQAGGDQNGQNLRSATYTANSLNQYTSRTVPGGFDVLGLANANASVTVNSSPADYRRGEYFHELVTVGNSSSAIWQSNTVTTSGGGATSGTVFVPKTPETFTADEDGNLIADGRWNYTWDAENRLIKMESRGDAPAGSRRRLEFDYDWQSRRIWKKVTNLENSQVIEKKFVYDGWNLLAELSPGNSLSLSFLWGTDLSGSMQGAGGVGGLLLVTSHSSPVTSHFVAFDANGNVAALISGTDGNQSARYDYGPFGEVIRATGLMATNNPFRFSTKYQDNETDLIYYGYRYYYPSTARWPIRDPIEESGGVNVYSFLANSSLSTIDSFGLTRALQYKAKNELLDEIRMTSSSSSANTMHKKDAIFKLYRIIGPIDVNHTSGTQHYINSSVYVFTSPFTVVTLAHELVHAYNDYMHTGLGSNDIIDEGSAYAFEQLISASRSLNNIDYLITHRGACAAAHDGSLEGLWQNHWRTFGNPMDYVSMLVSNYGDQYSFVTSKLVPRYTDVVLHSVDFANVRKVFGFKHSCKDISNAINLRLHGNCDCYRVTCDIVQKHNGDIAAGTYIDSIFK